MSKRKQAKDPRLVKMQDERIRAEVRSTAAFRMVRRAWRKYDKLIAAWRRLNKRMTRLERELVAEANGEK